MPQLIQNHSNRSLNIVDGFVLGRSLECSHIIEDISISRKHCLFTQKSGKWFLTDLSSNGIYINNDRILPKRPIALKNNDNIQFGSYRFQFVEESVTPTIRVTNYDNTEVINIDDSLMETNTVPEPTQQIASVPEVAPVPAPIVPTGVVPNSAAADITNDAFEEELTCSICTEMFINAVTLSCHHSFCRLCIFTWKKTSKQCPICRKPITAEIPCMALNNMVALVASKKSQEEQDRRAAIILAHEEEYKENTQGSKSKPSTSRGRGRRRNTGRRLLTRTIRGPVASSFDIINLDDHSDSDLSTDSLFPFLLDSTDESF